MTNMLVKQHRYLRLMRAVCKAAITDIATTPDADKEDSALFEEMLDEVEHAIGETRKPPTPDASIAMPTIEGPTPARRENSVFDEPWPGTKANLLGEFK